MKIITYIFLTILLWPMVIVLLFFGLRKSFTRYPKRLGLPDASMFVTTTTKWIWKVDSFIPFGNSFWFVDKPKPPRVWDEAFWEEYRQEQEELKKKLKDEYGIE